MRLRVGVIGAGHWHVEIYYLPALAEMDDVEVVALADPAAETLERRKPLAPGAKTYVDYREMLDVERPDFVFAHAPHCGMTELAAYLVEAGMPFHMEKPMGLDAGALAKVAEAAEAKGLFVSVPLVSRYFGAAARLIEGKDDAGDAFHYHYRQLAGPPDRYRAWGVDWMLDPEKAGPGPWFNFGPHAVDLMLGMTGWQPRKVFARASHALHGEAVPDLVSVQIDGGDGRIGVVEVGYTLEKGYERQVTLSTDKLHYSGPGDVGTIAWRDGREEVVDGPIEDESYRLYTRDVVRRVKAGEPPKVGIGQMVKVLRVLCAGRTALERGEAAEVEGE
jgi:predicted dehydrogenase